MWQVLVAAPRWAIQWLPSHLSMEQALVEGWSREDWEGNDRADDAAKARAKSADLAPVTLAR